MKKLLAVLLFVFIQTGSSSANENSFKSEIKINTFNAVFFNFVSQTLKIDDIWINEDKCTTGVKIACTYSLAGNLALIASADKSTGLIDGFNIIFANNSDVAKFGIVSGSIMALIDPELSQTKRSNAFIAMINGNGEGDDGRMFSGIDANYSMTVSNVAGVWFNVTAK